MKGKRSQAIVVSSSTAGERTSVSIRKIENGFIVNESTSGPKGYKETERFSPTKPDVEITTNTPKPRAKPQPKKSPYD